MNIIQPSYVFFLTADAVFRVETSGTFPSVGPEVFSRLPGQPLSTALSAAFAQLPRNAAVLLLDAEAWCQTLELPESQLKGLSPEALSALISFEAEAFSGLSSQAARHAYTLAPARNGLVACRIMQVSDEDIRNMAEASRRAHLRLVGISHPAFLLEVDSSAATVPDVSEGTMSAWVERWREHRAKGPPLPFIPAPAAPESPRRPVFIGAAAFLLAVGICWAVQEVGAFRLRGKEAALADLMALQAQADRFHQQAQAIRAETGQWLQQEAIEIKQKEQMDAARKALGFLLHALADSCPDGVMLRGIRAHGPFGLEVEGWSSNPRDTDAFFVALGEQVVPHGWSVLPGSVAARHVLANGGPWHFTCTLQPVPEEDSP
ncbi:MAG: hypothetical protein LBN38_04880 [Verrucomicrobiota bacterium]|jgi:hypothetical protein|nr:hypothetical protein [Verrucomicrobiota bacterium]